MLSSLCCVAKSGPVHLMVYVCFVQDMRQVWTNCHLYNKKETPIDRAGRQAEQLFQEKWNRSGFAAADARARRNNAGVAAPKFEPNEYGPPEKKLQRRSSGSKNGRTTAKKVILVLLSMQTVGLNQMAKQNASCAGLCTACTMQYCTKLLLVFN